MTRMLPARHSNGHSAQRLVLQLALHACVYALLFVPSDATAAASAPNTGMQAGCLDNGVGGEAFTLRLLQGELSTQREPPSGAASTSAP